MDDLENFNYFLCSGVKPLLPRKIELAKSNYKGDDKSLCKTELKAALHEQTLQQTYRYNSIIFEFCKKCKV
uniref:Uncharacterized protein n=1 Tax=Romanomermis culicivorax TaxID=13658 RepID=A0A915KQN6_ROMCU